MRLRNLFLVGALLLLISATPGLGEEYGHYFSVVRDTTGAAIEAAQVTVYLAGTNTLAVIYSDDQGTLKGNPHTSDAQGNYDFWAAPGLYKLSITKPGVGAVVTDNIPVGTQLHADSHKEGGTDEIGLNDLAGTLSSARIEDGTILSEDISATAGIEESKLSLNFPTHSNANDPSSNQKAAMSGTSGLPNNLNRYVTSQDPRMTNARTPSAHAASHGAGGGDPVTITQAQIASLNVGTDLTADLEEESHASEHELGGADELDVTGLSGVLADPQTVEVLRSGVSIASRSKVNLIPGTNVTMSVVDDGTKVDVTVGANVQASGLSFYEGLGLVQGDTTKLTYGVGFDLTTPSASEVQVDLDLSEITVSADEIGGIPASSPPADGDVLQYIAGDGEWIPSQITVDVQEESVSIGRVQSLNFGVGFATTLSGVDADIDLDLSEVTVSADEIVGLAIEAPLAPTDGQTLKWDDANSEWVAADDLSGSDVILGFPVVQNPPATDPSSGQVLVFDGTDDSWKPNPPPTNVMVTTVVKEGLPTDAILSCGPDCYDVDESYLQEDPYGAPDGDAMSLFSGVFRASFPTPTETSVAGMLLLRAYTYDSSLPADGVCQVNVAIGDDDNTIQEMLVQGLEILLGSPFATTLYQIQTSAIQDYGVDPAEVAITVWFSCSESERTLVVESISFENWSYSEGTPEIVDTLHILPPLVASVDSGVLEISSEQPSVSNLLGVEITPPINTHRFLTRGSYGDFVQSKISGSGQIDVTVNEGDGLLIWTVFPQIGYTIPSTSQVKELTAGGPTSLHYHTPDRALSNATGTLPAAQVGTGLTDAQVLDNLTISSSGSVAGGAIKSGTVAPTYLGDVAVETKSIIIPYPLPSSSVGYLYFPSGATITRVSARTRGANCNVGFKVNGTAILASDLAATTSGATTTTIANSAITAGAWGEYTIGASCPSTVTEVTINVTYRIGS